MRAARSPIRRLPTFVAAVLAAVLAGFFAAAVATAQDEETSAEFCAACHDEAVEAFTSGAHGRQMPEETLSRSCATCHGPVETHLEEFTAESINRWPEPEACVSCHTNALGNMRKATAAHPRNAVVCLDCHEAGHAAPKSDPLLLEPPKTLCGDCHGDVRSVFNLPFTHREGSETFECTTCHAVHGGGEAGRLWTLRNGGVCISCHTDKSGPFVYPHAPREVDGCVTCHAPHGSPNPRQLVRRNVFNLCLECHADVPVRSFHDFTQARFRRCQTCHRAVHGSNSEPALFDE